MDINVSKEKVRIEISDKKIEMEHFHQHIELCYVLSGRVSINMGSEEIVLFEEGIYLINANKKHSIRMSEDGLLVKVRISFELLADILGSLDVLFICNSNLGDSGQYDLLRKKLNRLLSHYVNTNGKVEDFGHISLCYDLLDTLVINFQIRESDMQKKDNDAFSIRVSQINNYVRGNYKGELSLKDLADKLYLSEAYLSRFFKKTYGMSFLKYVTNIRLSHAYDDVLYTDESITKIAFNNGFSTTALFNKSFKQVYGMNPSELRKCKEDCNKEAVCKKHSKELQNRLENFVRNGQENEDELLNSNELYVKHVIKPYEQLGTITTGYRNAVNGGSADDMLKAEVREHIAILADTLHFEYVRFWNIFTEAMLLSPESMDEENGEFNFSKIDGIIDFILQHNLKPAFELGAKPKRITKNINEPILCEPLDGLKYDRERWGRLIDKFFRHLNDYYGMDEVKTWIVELWCDERGDLIPGYNYFDLFNQTAGIIRSLNKNIRIGGCGLRDDKSQEAITAFLKEWRGQKEQPDFISMICFPYVSGEIKLDVYSRRSTDNDFVNHAIEKIKTCVVSAGFDSNLPIFISEWNVTLSDRNAINDSCFKGAYILKNIIQNIDSVSGVGYFLATDRLVEHFDTNELLFGGSGLITKDSILKPAAYAFEFMNRLKPKLVGKGKEYIITEDENGNFTILAHNQKKLNYNYFLTNEGDINKGEIWKYYEDNDALIINFELSSVDGNQYKIRTHRVNDEHGSILGIWKGLDYEKSLSKGDIGFCRKICVPELSISTANVENNTLKFQIRLKANEITSITLKKI